MAERPRGRPTAPTPFSVPPPPPNAVFGPRPGSAARGSRGTSSGDALDAAQVDLDRASAAEIERLPRIGPALAQRIVDDRRRLGPFGSIEGLQRVRGIGPALAETLRARVTFSTAGRPYNARSGAGSPPSLPAGPTPRRSRPRRGDAGSDGW